MWVEGKKPGCGDDSIKASRVDIIRGVGYVRLVIGLVLIAIIKEIKT
jgi:hypothetical protein